MICTSGWFYVLAVAIRGFERVSHQKRFSERWRERHCSGQASAFPHLPVLISGLFFFFFLGNLVWLFPLCFVCAVWGCDKIPVFKIQEEHSIPVVVFICFHSLVRVLCSGVEVLLCKGTSEPVQAKLNVKPFRPVGYVGYVWWFVADSVRKDGLVMRIIGLVSE